MPYDLIVIGSGPGGYVCAIRAAQLGMKTAVIEKWATFGGTCLNIGCIPSKAMLNASELFEEAAHKFGEMGIKVGKPTIDLAAMLKYKQTGVDGNVKGVDYLFKKNKIETFRGTGRIAAPGKVEVKSADGKSQVLETKAIVIATGSDVARLNGIDIDEKRVVSSTGALDFSRVPQKLLIVGAGIIGLELGSVWRRLGAEVTIVEFLDHILPGIDSEVARQFHRMLEKQGLTFQAVIQSHRDRRIGQDAESEGRTRRRRRTAETIEADNVLVAIGRVPYTEGLGLEAVGVKKDNRGRVIVDPHYKTNVDGIYAIGDVIAGPMLAHKAEEEGVAVAENLAGQAGHVNYGVIPNVVYTYPEIASVGKTEEELKVGRRGLQRRKVSLHRQPPRQGEPDHRGLCENPCRRQDRPRARRAHSRPRRRQHDRRGRHRHGVRRLVGGHRAHLPRPSDAAGSGEGSRALGSQARD